MSYATSTVFSNDPKSAYYIKNLQWCHELNRILSNPYAKDNERLFLVCFLRDKLGWNEVKVIRFLEFYNKWENLNFDITTRQVNIIFEKRADGRLKGYTVRSKASYHSWFLSETRTEETQRQKNMPSPTGEGQIETVPTAPQQNNANLHFGAEFGVSFRDRRTTEMEGMPMEEVKVFAKINNGNRWFKVSEKSGQFGNFYSIDSGQLMDVTTDDGKQVLGYGKPDRFFSLPKEPKTLKELINGLEQLLPELTEQPLTKKK